MPRSAIEEVRSHIKELLAAEIIRLSYYPFSQMPEI